MKPTGMSNPLRHCVKNPKPSTAFRSPHLEEEGLGGGENSALQYRIDLPGCQVIVTW